MTEQNRLINYPNNREYERTGLEQELDAVIGRPFILVTHHPAMVNPH